MRIAVAVIIFSITFTTQASLTVSRETKLAELKERLRELEKQQTKMDDWYSNFYVLGNGKLTPFLKEKVSLGGYFETGIINMRGPNTENQTVAAQQALGVNITAEFSEKLRFVNQTSTVYNIPLLNVNNNPNLTPPQRSYLVKMNGTYILQGYLEYSHNEFFNVQSGLGYVPFGIAFQQRDAYLFHQRGGPQMITNDDGFNISVASALWMGLHFYGILPFFEASTVGYDLYSMTPGSNKATLGFGGRLWWAINEYTKAGTSFQYGEKMQGSYVSQGFDLDIKYRQYGLLAEYATADNSQALDSESYYIEPYYKFLEDQWLIYASVDYLRSLDRNDVFTQIPDPFEVQVYGFGVNWLPLPNTRYRLGYSKYNYLNEFDSTNGQKKDYEAIEFSAAIAF